MDLRNNRILVFQFTDGVTMCRAIEFTQIPKITFVRSFYEMNAYKRLIVCLSAGLSHQEPSFVYKIFACMLAQCFWRITTWKFSEAKWKHSLLLGDSNKYDSFDFMISPTPSQPIHSFVGYSSPKNQI